MVLGKGETCRKPQVLSLGLKPHHQSSRFFELREFEGLYYPMRVLRDALPVSCLRG